MIPYEFTTNRYLPGCIRFTHPIVRECLSEFASTFVLLLCGTGTVLQYKTSKGQLDTTLGVNLSWGFAVMIGGGLGIGMSGGQMNPAITFAQFLLGRKSFLQFVAYVPAQVLGGMGGAALAYSNYINALNAFDGGKRTATGEFGSLCFVVTCGAQYETHWDGVLDQVIGTAVLTASMCSVIDSRNAVPRFLHPVFGGFAVMLIGLCYGVNGYPINPARDLGPRLFALCVYGPIAFTDNNYWFWIPIVGPMLGCIAGTIFYNFLFDLHTPAFKNKAIMKNEKDDNWSLEGVQCVKLA